MLFLLFLNKDLNIDTIEGLIVSCVSEVLNVFYKCLKLLSDGTNFFSFFSIIIILTSILIFLISLSYEEH